MKELKNLDDLHTYWSLENDCKLKADGTRAVFGKGNPKAQIIFIGEAPGKKEDELGVPFVGSAGKVLDKLLETIKLNRNDVYITNIVKYRPPKNRDPLKNEKESCFPWLISEINFIRPKILILLGRHALNTFFPDEEISKVHGKLMKKKYQGIKCQNFYVLYHPASALYNPNLLKTHMVDFKRIPIILKG